MNLNEIRQASLFNKIPLIQHLRRLGSKVRLASSKSILRVAERAIRGNIVSPEMDLLVRLQVLEGAAGKPAWTWSKSPRQGLRQARKFFEENGITTLDPAWLERGNTGMIKGIVSKVAPLVKGKGTQNTAEDIVQNGLMGLNSWDPGGKSVGTPKAYKFGLKFGDSVIKGGSGSSPSSLGAGTVGQWFARMALDELRAYQRDVSRQGPQVRDDDATGQIEDPSQNEQPRFTQFLFDVMGQNSNAGRTLRELFRQSAGSKPERQTIVNTMLDMVESGSYRDIEKVKNDLAAELGYTNSATVSAHLRRAIIPTFEKALKNNRIYHALLEEYTLRYTR